MDSADYSSDWDPGEADTVAAPPEVANAIGTDERRMHVRAYNHWCALLDGRDYPSIADLDPGDIQDFGPHSVLLDFSKSVEHPATPYIGSAVRAECGLAADGVQTIDDVPSRSLLSRLTGHYMEIIANRAPVGFEAEFVNQRGRSISYRGILMPFSSDGATIDFIYGVINWKDQGEGVAQSAIIAPALVPIAIDASIEDDTDEEILELTDPVATPAHLSWEDGPLAGVADEIVGDDVDEQPIPLDAEAGLADRLWAARESADVCRQADGRSRAALYRALAMAYDFAVAARRVPHDYAALLEDAGVKAQDRAPMTPIVKLVFGLDYDKTRLTEFAAALSHAARENVEFGGFLGHVESADGGLKGLVAAERQARRPAGDTVDKSAAARAVLRRTPAMKLVDLPTIQEFALVVTRRNAAGVHEVVQLVSDPAMLERAIRRVG